MPVPIATTDGRLFADGLVVMTYVEGEPPETEADWRRVADSLRQLHRLTQGWPQRPGWRSSTDLLHAETGTKIDLGAMPPEGVARCRAAWARLAGHQTCVVHGDPNPGNIRMTADRVGMIDWDESHVDVADLDLVLPHNAAGLNDGAHDIAAQAFGRVGRRRLLGRRVRSQAARRSSSGLSAIPPAHAAVPCVVRLRRGDSPVHRPGQPAPLRPKRPVRRRRAAGMVRPPDGTPSGALDLARAADLWALVDLAARPATTGGRPRGATCCVRSRPRVTCTAYPLVGRTDGAPA